MEENITKAKLQMSRRKKEQKNLCQVNFYKNFVKADSKTDFEKMIDAITLLQNVGTKNELNVELQRQEELSNLKKLAYFSGYFETLSKILAAKNVEDILKNIELDTSKLKAGQIFKSFNELCRVIEIKPPSGKRQREEYKTKFKRFFDFVEMDYSNQIMILEIYEIPFENNRGKFIREMQLLILNYLLAVASKNTEIIDSEGYMEYKTTYSKMMKNELKLISPYFYYYKNDNSLVDDFFCSKYPQNFSYNNIVFNRKFLYNKLYSKIKSSISTALKKLNKVDEMIDLEEFYIVKIMDSKTDTWHWEEIKSQKEKTYIKNTRKSVAESLGYKTSWDCLYNGKKEEFEQKFFDCVQAEKGWMEVRFRVSIGFNVKHILKFIGEYTEVSTYRQILNENLSIALNQSAVKVYQESNKQYIKEREKYIECIKEMDFRSNKEISEEYDDNNCSKRKYLDDFPDNQKLMIAYIVNPDNNKKEELIEYKKQWLSKKPEISTIDNLFAEDEDELFMDAK